MFKTILYSIIFINPLLGLAQKKSFDTWMLNKTKSGIVIEEYKEQRATVSLTNNNIAFHILTGNKIYSYSIEKQVKTTVNGYDMIIYSCLDKINNKHHYVNHALTGPNGYGAWFLYLDDEKKIYLMFVERYKYL